MKTSTPSYRFNLDCAEQAGVGGARNSLIIARSNMSIRD